MLSRLLRLALVTALVLTVGAGPSALAQSNPNPGGATGSTTPPATGVSGGGASSPAQGDQGDGGGNDSKSGWIILAAVVLAGAGVAFYLSRREKAADRRLSHEP